MFEMRSVLVGRALRWQGIGCKPRATVTYMASPMHQTLATNTDVDMLGELLVLLVGFASFAL